MPCQLSDEINYVNDDVFSYMCNLAMEKCSRKMEKKKASCGGAAMRKRLLIKNFVAQMLAQEKQTREQSLLNESDDDFTLKSLDSSYIFSSASAGNQSISPEMEIDEDEEQHLETGDDEEEEEESELNKSHLEEEDEEVEDEEEESKDENIGNREDQEAEAAAATIMATNGKANSGFMADNNNNNRRLIDDSLRLFRSQSDKMEDLVDEEDRNERTSLHNLLSITSHKEKPPCWRNAKIHQRKEEDDDDEFHRVPTPERQKLYWQNRTNNQGDEPSADLFNNPMQDQPQNDGKTRIDESSSQAAAVIEIAPNLVGSPLTDHTVADWRYFDDSTAIHVNFITTGQFRSPAEDAAYFLANENILSLNDDDDHHSPMKIPQEDETKLFLLERAGVDGEMDAQHSQLAGLVNMVPSSFKFNFGPTRPSNCLTELENVNKLADTYFRHHQLGNRKRPWSLVFDDQMMDIQQEMSTPSHFPQSFTTPSETATLLSPLCCGLLQLQPFNGATADLHNGLTTEGAVPQTQPLMKRVKL